MGKKYRWNRRKFANNMAEIALWTAVTAGWWYLIYLWAMA